MEQPTSLLFDLLSKTALVLALLYGFVWGLRKFTGSAAGIRLGPTVQIIQSAHLGPGRSVHLISVGNKGFLVGATSHHVSLIARVDVSEADHLLVEGRESRPFDGCLQRASQLLASVCPGLRSGREDGRNARLRGSDTEIKWI